MIGSFDEHTVMVFYNRMSTDDQHRYKSWEHCYTAFCEEEDITTLSLHLGFYLASWGMYRGSSGLLQKDFTIHKEAIEVIKSSKYAVLNTHVKEIERENISLLLELKNDLKNHYQEISYIKENKQQKITPTDTLITKIILGTLGCVPAYDRYYIDGIKEIGLKGYTLNELSLNNLFDFIDVPHNREAILRTQKEISQNGIQYPMMKILDMFFWEIGFKLNKTKKGQNLF